MATTAATVTTVAVAGTSAGLLTFATPVEWVSIRNESGVTCYFLFNDGSTAAAVATADFSLANNEVFVGQASEIAPGGKIKTLGTWVPATGIVAQLYVRGSV